MGGETIFCGKLSFFPGRVPLVRHISVQISKYLDGRCVILCKTLGSTDFPAKLRDGGPFPIPNAFATFPSLEKERREYGNVEELFYTKFKIERLKFIERLSFTAHFG